MTDKVESIRKEIERRIRCLKVYKGQGVVLVAGVKDHLRDLLSFIDSMQEDDVPEYSCFETIYKCGKKPHWNVGDTLAFYEFYSDREGENVLGKVTKVELMKDIEDWFYTFEDGSVWDEESLLNEETYKKK